MRAPPNYGLFVEKDPLKGAATTISNLQKHTSLHMNRQQLISQIVEDVLKEKSLAHTCCKDGVCTDGMCVIHNK